MSNTYKIQAARFTRSSRVSARDVAPTPIAGLVEVLKFHPLAGERFGNQRKARAAMKVKERRLERASARVSLLAEVSKITQSND